MEVGSISKFALSLYTIVTKDTETALKTMATFLTALHVTANMFSIRKKKCL